MSNPDKTVNSIPPFYYGEHLTQYYIPLLDIHIREIIRFKFKATKHRLLAAEHSDTTPVHYSSTTAILFHKLYFRMPLNINKNIEPEKG